MGEPDDVEVNDSRASDGEIDCGEIDGGEIDGGEIDSGEVDGGDHDPAPDFASFVLPDRPSDSLTSADPGSGDGRAFAARVIEAVLMVATDPVPPQFLADLLEMAVVEVEEVAEELAASYEMEERGFCLRRVAGGYRYESQADLAAYVERFVLEGAHARLSAAALETLAIVAYKQPVSRGQMAAIRGVNVDGVLRTLVQKGYVTEVGRYGGPGQAALYGTTEQFLESLGLDRIEDLPALGDFVPSAHLVEALERGLLADPDADPRAMRVFPPVAVPQLHLSSSPGGEAATAPDAEPFAYIEPDPAGPAPVVLAAAEVEVGWDDRDTRAGLHDRDGREPATSPPSVGAPGGEMRDMQPVSPPTSVEVGGDVAEDEPVPHPGEGGAGGDDTDPAAPENPENPEDPAW